MSVEGIAKATPFYKPASWKTRANKMENEPDHVPGCKSKALHYFVDVGVMERRRIVEDVSQRKGLTQMAKSTRRVNTMSPRYRYDVPREVRELGNDAVKAYETTNGEIPKNHPGGGLFSKRNRPMPNRSLDTHDICGAPTLHPSMACGARPHPATRKFERFERRHLRNMNYNADIPGGTAYNSKRPHMETNRVTNPMTASHNGEYPYIGATTMDQDPINPNSEGGPRQRPQSAAPTRDQPRAMCYASGERPQSAGSRSSSGGGKVVTLSQQVEDSEAAFKLKLFEHHHTVLAAFRQFDDNHDGSVSKKELKKFLENVNLPLDDAVFDTVVANIDDDGNGEVDYHEFMRYFGKDIMGEDVGGFSDEIHVHQELLQAQEASEHAERVQEVKERLAEIRRDEAHDLRERAALEEGEGRGEGALRLERVEAVDKDDFQCEVLHVNNNTVVPDPAAAAMGTSRFTQREAEEEGGKENGPASRQTLDLPQQQQQRELPRTGGSRPTSATVRSRPGSAASSRSKASYVGGTAASRSRSRSRPSSATVRGGRAVLEAGKARSRPTSAVSRTQRQALGGSHGGGSCMYGKRDAAGELGLDIKRALGDAQANRWTDVTPTPTS